MNSEESRLRTFRNWPPNAPVDARRIAKAGFYYMGQDLEVQCFSCGGRIADWNYNDKVMTRHRALDPRCPFVISPALSGNIPVTNCENQVSNSNQNDSTLLRRTSENTSTTSSMESPTSPDMHDETARLKTFSNWPISFIVSPKSLSEAGFYYVQQGDKVRCAVCSVIIGRWETGDSPLLEHRRHSPHCVFLAGHPSSSESDHSNAFGITFRPNTDSSETGSIKSLGVQIHKAAKHPKYSSKDARLSTYTNWALNMSQTPDDLAEAGFYYAGSDDQVRCFHCDGGLRKWDPSDDPWVEHARWFPDCGFVTLFKGEQFIDEAIQSFPPILPELASNDPREVERRRPGGDSRPRHSYTEDQLEELMSSSLAAAALQIGLDQSRVKTALRQKLEQTGTPFTSAYDLIEAALEIQLDEVPYHDTEETWSTPLHSPLLLRKPLRPRTTEQIQAACQDSDSSDTETFIKNQLVSRKAAEASSLAAEPSPSTVGEVDTRNACGNRMVLLEEENRRLREARLCKICMDNEVCVVFLPCGHLVTCVNCAHSIEACPVCRHTIKATVRTFLS